MAYATPDVYIKEISTFPPSVAEVETAIPAFIGHTEKAIDFQTNDLRNKPKLVKSLLEYQQYFGFGAPVNISSVSLDENNAVSAQGLAASFYMYDALRLYFKNGGGKCYILSIADYQTKVDATLFGAGLSALKKQDEPTLILFPDAVKLSGDGLYNLQVDTLKQCSKLQDRFGVFDLLESKPGDPTFGWQQGVDEFRGKIGMASLKYGAAYTPWVKTALGQNVRYRDIKGKLSRGGVPTNLTLLTNDADVVDTITDLDNATANSAAVEDELTTLIGPNATTLRLRYQALVDDLQADAANVTKLAAIIDQLFKMVEAIDRLEAGFVVRDAGINNLKSDTSALIASAVVPAFGTLVDLELEAVADLALIGRVAAVFTNAGLIGVVGAGTASAVLGGGTTAEQLAEAASVAGTVFNQVSPVLTTLAAAALAYEVNTEELLKEGHPVFAGIIKHLNAALTLCPPSGAVVGAMALVDSSRGVWKAPANVSLASVSEPTELIDNVDQATLNIDTVAGKSINAIRKFTGKGTLIWGARTLMGNDNEWRYINVRRFFNMVEESIKKSTYWAVFEPNDANTWIKVKAMIENYLNQKWRDGALQGSKPEQAFFVNVGLGTTMTPQDILEGRMNVEIGMAVVRPAEFIILSFSHKLPEA